MACSGVLFPQTDKALQDQSDAVVRQALRNTDLRVQQANRSRPISCLLP